MAQPDPTDPDETDLDDAESAELIDAVRRAVVTWFARGHRDLPWRRTRDPYAVWVSEIMLQQTRVDTVVPRYLRWMARFPTATALARASLDEVLAEWAGLGYYARARNLHLAARQIEEHYGGELPESEKELAALPGIGPYTRGAILSIAYGQEAPLLDGNVERVLARIFRVGGDPKSANTKKRLWDLAERLVRGTRSLQMDPSRLNQGLMELGAMVCLPRNPACLVCPLREACKARKAGLAEAYPEAGRVTRVQEVAAVSVALVRDGRVLLMRRPPEGLWGGLYELPSGELHVGETALGAARRVVRERAGLDVSLEALAPLPGEAARFEHLLSHRRITFYGFLAEAPVSLGRVRRGGYDAHRFVTPRAALDLGVSQATRRQIEALATEAEACEKKGRPTPTTASEATATRTPPRRTRREQA